MKKLLRKILIPLVFITICGIFFCPTLIHGKLPVPTDTLIGLYHPWRDLYANTNPRGVAYKNFLITDPIRQQIPWKKLVIDSLKQGHLPSWNPYSFSGTSLVGNIQAGSFYPLNSIFLLFSFPIAWTITIMLQPILAGLFMYLFLKRKHLHQAATLIGAITWSFCGFFIAWLTWGTIDQTALWMPLMFLAIDMIFDYPSRSGRMIALRSLILTLIVVCSIFAGHAQVAFYILIFAAVYAVFQSVHSPQKHHAWWIVGAVSFAVIISSIQWVPLLQTLTHSSRIGDVGVWLKDGWFLPWQHMVQFIAPDFFGNPATLNYWGIWNYGEFVGYIGILPLIVAFYAVIVRKDRMTRFFAIALVVIFLFLLPTPIAKIPFELRVPVLSAMQPTRLMVLVDFCLAVLAALGMDFFLRNKDKKIFYGIGTVLCLLAGMWVYVIIMPKLNHNPDFSANLLIARRNLLLPTILFLVSSICLVSAVYLKKRYVFAVIGVAVIIVSYDLLRFGWKFTPFTPPEYFFPSTQVVAFLQLQPKPFRVMSLDARLLPPNTASYYGIESVEGYDPVYSARYEEFIAALNRQKPDITPPFGFNRIITVSTVHSPLLPILNVKYILSLDNLNDPDLELVFQEGQTNIYRYTKALPRIYPVESVLRVNSKQQTMDLLYSPEFNAASQAIVEDQVTVPEVPESSGDHIDITEESDSEIHAISSLQADHFVVVANMYDADWKAFIDSTPIPIHRTNYLFQGIVVPKGDHTIVVKYQ